MPTFKITDPQTGEVILLRRQSPPSEQELEEIFSQRQKSTDSSPNGKFSDADKSNPNGKPAQVSKEQQGKSSQEENREEGQDDEIRPDVLLDVADLHIDEIDLEVEDLDARIALSAHLANLVKIDVGAHVGIDKVELNIKGVQAKAALRVRLDRVYQILARALQTIDQNPDLLKEILTPLGQAAGEIGTGASKGVKELVTGAGESTKELSETAEKTVDDVGEEVQPEQKTEEVSQQKDEIKNGPQKGNSGKNQAAKAKGKKKEVKPDFDFNKAARKVLAKEEPTKQDGSYNLPVKEAIDSSFHADEEERKLYHRQDKALRDAKEDQTR
ncbi:hypothetical protein CHISP_1058 [Chitinispirillum alkaliphilum]|nr:hypothetical protein CHISP_1058 [Chitinispirillum alkaliphilum]